MDNGTTTRRGPGGWWRWPLVPVAGIIAAVLGALVITALQDIAIGFQDDYAKDGWVHLYAYPLVPSAIFGYLLAVISIRVAPSSKTNAGIAMTGLMVFVLIALTGFLWISEGVPRGDVIQTSVGAVAAIAGGVVGLVEREGPAG